MAEVVGTMMTIAPEAAGLLSGGVDSTYIQAHSNRLCRFRNSSGKPGRRRLAGPSRGCTGSGVCLIGGPPVGYQPLVGPPDGARSATNDGNALGGRRNAESRAVVLLRSLARRVMAENGISAGLCGEGADELFGNEDAALLQCSGGLRQRVPTRALRWLGQRASKVFRHGHASHTFRLSNVLGDEGDVDHPLNSAAAFTKFASVARCFGREAVAALQRRRSILDRYRVPEDALGLQRVLAIGYLAEAVNTAAYWNQVASQSGVELLCPFMDSRIVRAALNIRVDARFVAGSPKEVLKMALARHVPEEFARRPKRGFGQPIFEWLADGGPSAGAVDMIGDYGFVDRRALPAQEKAELVFVQPADLRSLAQSVHGEPRHPAEARSDVAV